MAAASFVHPSLNVLNQEQIVQIHQYALQILSSTGVQVHSKRAQETLVQRIGASAMQGDRVCIPPEVVEWALSVAPPVIEIYDRRGKSAFQLGEDRTRFGIGVTTLFYQDPLSDAITPFGRSHMQQMVRLGECLPRYDAIATVGIIQDVPSHLSDLYENLEMVANTSKPLVILISDEHNFPAVLDLLENLHGDLSTRPFIIPYFNPVTPLILNEGTVDKMYATIERGLPFIFSNYSMAGTSTPITPAGTLAVLMAELLAGLTLSQVIKEGTPVILGILPAYFDMKTLVNFYDPLSILLNLACAEMMAHYHLPHCGTSGSGTGWGPDLMAADTYWMNQLTACLGKVGLAPFVGDNLNSKAFSPCNVVYVHEVIEQALRFAGGFALDEAAIGLDEIQTVGPGGNFLSTKTTRKLFRQAYYESPVFPRLSMEKWEAQGRPRAGKVLREHTVELLNNLPVPEDHDELMRRGEEFIKGLK